MKLTRKLSIAIGLGILVILFVQATTRYSLDSNSYRRDVRRDHDIFASTIASIVQALYRTEGLERALELIDDENETHPNVMIRWVEVGGASTVEDAPRNREAFDRSPHGTVHVVDESRSTPTMLTYVSVNAPGRRAAIELFETLDGERAAQRVTLERAAMTTGSMVLLCFALTAGFGVFFVARPLRELTALTEAVGRGEFDHRIEIRQNDEIRDLARAFEAMTTKLREAREKEREAVSARINALEQLRHSDRLRTIGEIASAVAHELGTPLNVVRARGSMIASGEVSEARSRELGSVIVAQVDRMSKSIRSLLDFSRREPTNVAPLSLSKLVEKMKELVEPLARERGVMLTTEVDADVRIDADASQLEQMLTNLVVNAIHAAENGNVRVHVIDGDIVTIDVEDDGPGMDDELLARAKEPFVTTKNAGEGTGLGLAIANEIALEHGGELTLERLEPHGLRARLRLPGKRSSAR